MLTNKAQSKLIIGDDKMAIKVFPEIIIVQKDKIENYRAEGMITTGADVEVSTNEEDRING